MYNNLEAVNQRKFMSKHLVKYNDFLISYCYFYKNLSNVSKAKNKILNYQQQKTQIETLQKI